MLSERERLLQGKKTVRETERGSRVYIEVKAEKKNRSAEEGRENSEVARLFHKHFV